jgi:hypothetical protein
VDVRPRPAGGAATVVAHAPTSTSRPTFVCNVISAVPVRAIEHPTAAGGAIFLS